MKVSTGCADLDAMFRYDSSLLTTVYGEAAAGKTTLALLAAVAGAKEKKVVFIDTENGFSMERLRQLAPGYGSLISNIVRVHPSSLEEQERLVLELSERHCGMVIVDTVGFFYRLEVKQDPYRANKSLDVQLRKLSELARKGVFVLLTNQVYADLDGKIHVVGGDMMRNWSKCLIHLAKDPRRLRVEKPFELEVLFEIKESGIFRKDYL